MRKQPNLTARSERFREVLRVNLKYAESDGGGAKRDFYLHFHEIKIDTNLITEDAIDNPRTRDHFYRPEAFWQVFVERPELVDDDELFFKIYSELGRTVIVSRRENNFLARRFPNVLTSQLYKQAGMRLAKRDGNKMWRSAIPLGHCILPVPDFMEKLEKEVLGRV
jgi:hypothetical protein